MLRLLALSSAVAGAAADALRGSSELQALSEVAGTHHEYRCVFVHGIGVGVTKPTSREDTQEYWGGTKNIVQYTPYCKERLFLQQDTLSRGWDHPTLSKAFCDAAVRAQEKDNVVRDTVVIAHSMGNLIVAEALMSQACALDKNSSHWVSLSAPWRGSQVVPWLFNVCSKSPPSEILQWLAKKLGYCDPEKPGEPHVGYDSLRPDYPKIKSGELTLFAHNYVTHAICGDSAYGLTSYLSAALEALAAAVGFTDPNDGMVGVDSCQLPDVDYGQSFADTKYYMALINHADSTCRNGNGAFGHASRQPCRWLRDIFGPPPGAELSDTLDSGATFAPGDEPRLVPSMADLKGVHWVRAEADDDVAVAAPSATEIVV